MEALYEKKPRGQKCLKSLPIDTLNTEKNQHPVLNADNVGGKQ